MTIRYNNRTRHSDTTIRHYNQTRHSDTTIRHYNQTRHSDTTTTHYNQTRHSDTIRHHNQTRHSDTDITIRHDTQTQQSDITIRHDTQTQQSDITQSDTTIRHYNQTRHSDTIRYYSQTRVTHPGTIWGWTWSAPRYGGCAARWGFVSRSRFTHKSFLKVHVISKAYFETRSFSVFFLLNLITCWTKINQ